MPIISSLGTSYSLLLRWVKRPFASSMAIAVNEMDDDIVLGLLVKLQAPQPVEIDINKKLLPKQKTIQTFNIEAERFRKTKNENLPMQEIEVAS